MTIAAIPSLISSLVDSYQAYQASGQNKVAQFQQDLQAISTALQSGDLSGAQKPLADLQQLLPSSTGTSQTQAGQQNPVTADLNALSSALKNSNVSDANAAYAKLQQDIQSMQGHHHHHHHHKVHGTNQTSAQNPLANDFQTLAQSLQSGDLSGAQKAFAQLQQDAHSKYSAGSQASTGSAVTNNINVTA